MFYTDKVENMDDRIIVPIKDIRGRIKVFVGRHVLSNANPRYMIYPPKAEMQLFPAVLQEPTKKLLLVEGLFDFLNLYDKGLKNVVATLGTATLLGSSLATKMLPFKSQGVSKIYICFDGDKAGSDASAKLKPLLEALNFEVEIVELEEGTDPGSMDQESVDRLKKYTEND
jgi:DNA primase